MICHPTPANVIPPWNELLVNSMILSNTWAGAPNIPDIALTHHLSTNFRIDRFPVLVFRWVTCSRGLTWLQQTQEWIKVTQRRTAITNMFDFPPCFILPLAVLATRLMPYPEVSDLLFVLSLFLSSFSSYYILNRPSTL